MYLKTGMDYKEQCSLLCNHCSDEMSDRHFKCLSESKQTENRNNSLIFNNLLGKAGSI